ncbi:RCC1 repeat-containing protein [Bifidobacterium scardovii]|uniref:RCC1 repeat-containing protein n=2 Tax=Bifidobacterium scardovii TaxID=158787 RepID=A0A087D6A3_9BIFI|nr:RCC1 repeat-containing protein [Bifidobacterium scardovii]
MNVLRRPAAMITVAATLMVGLAVAADASVRSAAGVEARPSYATAKLVKIVDGTGHGTAAQSFVNSRNGFQPGDDAPDDGIVSSGDVVEYALRLSFTAAAKRQVRVAWDLRESPWLSAGDAATGFCSSGQQVSAKRDGDACVYTVNAGAVEVLDQRLVLRAKDTEGTAKTGQKPRLTVSRVGEDSSTVSYPTDEVTVVSAPAADLIIDNGGYPDKPHEAWARRNEWVASGTISGYFDLKVKPLTYPGYTTSHGASISGPWSASVDVSAFPEGSTFSVDGTMLPVRDGRLRLGGMRGDKRLDWSVPAERVADMKQNDTRIYDIAVIPDKTSFSADGGNALLNMGDGTEPGMNAKRDKDTGSRDTGAKSGYPYANNDWSRAIIERNNTRGSVFSKLLQRPYTPGKTLFDPESQDFAKASSDQTIIHYYSADQNGDTVATGTQTRVTLSMAADRIEGVLSSDPVLGDEWDPTQQQWQGGLSVTRGGKPLDQGVDWNASYTYDDPRSGNAAWHDGVPADTDAKVRAIRVSFDRARFQSAADTGTVRVVFLTRVTVDAARGNVKSSDTMTGEFTTDQETARAEGDNFVWVIAPSEPAASIDTAVTVTDGMGTERADGAQPGDTAGYVIRPRLTNIQRSGTVVKPTITVTYPDGLLDPVMAGGPWKLTISGSGAGRTITFTYDSPDGTLIPELGVDGSVDLPAIEWRATVGNKAAGTISAAATQTTDIAQNGTVPAHPQVTSNTAVAQFIVDAKAGETGALNALTGKTGIGDSLSWRFNLYAKGSGRTGGADTIVRVPSNDDAIMAGDNNTGLDGSWREYDRGHSAYHGTWKLTEPVSVNAANSTATSILYSTSVAWTDEPDDYEWKTWEQLSDEDKSRITAIRVRSDFETGSDGNMPVAAADGTITLIPTDGTKDDRYVMWPGRTRFSDGHAMGNLPWADAVTATAGSISGTLWWDRNENTLIDAGEECIGGIEVSLWRADENGGRMGDAPLRTVNSDGDGRYEFDLLHAGNYRVQVKRSTGTSTGDGVQTSVTTYYSQDKPVAGTRSWNSRLKGQARDESDVIRLTVGADQQRVDFGYAKPDPKATLDKTQTRLSCTADSCEINWDVKVTNSGKTTDKIHIPPTISNGGANSFALDSTGHLWAWGDNSFGQLGDGTTTERHTPVAVTPDRTYTTVSTGTYHSLALDSTGHLWAWGDNSFGQLGDGTTTDRRAPVEITPDRTYAMASDASPESAGTGNLPADSVLSDRMSGIVENVRATAGTVSRTEDSYNTFKQVSSSSFHTLALDSSGHVWTWGSNSNGQLGDGTNTDRQTPADVTTVTQGVAVDPTAVPVDPVSETQDGGDVIRTYNPPYTIAPGGYIVFHFTGTVSRAQADRIVHNQAWFDSPDTPYAGTPHALRENTTTPFKPDDTKLDRSSHDITGNPSCRTGTDYRNPGMEHWFSNGNEDSCDQVGALIPAYTTEPVRGSISGMYWRDQNRDGIRQDTETDRIPGLSVILENQAGERISTTVTDRNGAYRFDKLPLGSYRIRFSRVPRADFTTPDASDANPVVDSSSTDSDAGTGEDYGMGTPLITLTETTPDRDHIDAGVLADKPWTGILPHTGLFVLPCLMILALAAMIASILLLRQPAAKERDSEKHGS